MGYSILFQKEKDNRVAVIAKHFNVGTATVQRIINDYLKTKIRDKISV